MSFICIKKCYRSLRVYKPGDEWEGDESNVPKEFVHSSQITKARKGLIERPKLGSKPRISKPQDVYTDESKKAREALGHTNQNVAPRNDAEDPFAGMYDKGKDESTADDFLS